MLSKKTVVAWRVELKGGCPEKDVVYYAASSRSQARYFAARDFACNYDKKTLFKCMTYLRVKRATDLDKYVEGYSGGGFRVNDRNSEVVIEYSDWKRR
jgi:hypothetical protein